MTLGRVKSTTVASQDRRTDKAGEEERRGWRRHGEEGEEGKVEEKFKLSLRGRNRTHRKEAEPQLSAGPVA